VGQGTSDPEIFAFRNGGAANSWTRESISSLNVYSGVLTDVDGDGLADIVAPDHWNSGPVRWFRNETIQVPEPAAGSLVAWLTLLWRAHDRRRAIS
jgi:hypothetical protein